MELNESWCLALNQMDKNQEIIKWLFDQRGMQGDFEGDMLWHEIKEKPSMHDNSDSLYKGCTRFKGQ